MRALLMGLITFISVSAFAGIRDVGNGGDAIALEFTTLARQVSKDIKIEAQHLFPEFSAEDLESVIESTKVASVDKTILNGVEKDAINYPRLKLIEVSRSRWKSRSVSTEKLRALVLHEYLGIMNINDADYKISGRLIDYYLDSKKRIIESEIDGRIFITDQEDATIQGLVVIERPGRVTFQGIVMGELFNCSGSYHFNENEQVLKSQLNCDESNANLVLNLWNTDVVDYLRGGLVEVDFSFTHISKTGDQVKQMNKTIDAKQL
jgi:hypothetical protein